MSASRAIQVTNVGKCYRIYRSPRSRLAQGFLGESKKLYKEKWALRGVSFELSKGQTLGVIGRNGSGKSTLLQLLCGTLTPTEGIVTCHGRVAALLELGSGFNPEFNGIENIFLNASVLGLTTRETEEKLDAILAFADIGDYVNQPLKTYSSGMSLRLAFAVQANIDPDILIVDEALAVGDELFQKKCYSHIRKLKDAGTSILLVTHSCPQIIQHCDEALLLHKGQPQLLGRPAVVTATYQQLANAPDSEWERVIPRANELQLEHTESTALNDTKSSQWADTSSSQNTSLIPKTTQIYPSHGIEILNIQVETPEGRPLNQLCFRTAFQLRFFYRSSEDLRPQKIRFGCHIATTEGLRVTGQAYPSIQDEFCPAAGDQWEVVFSFGPGLYPGVYFVGGGVMPKDNTGIFLHRVIDFIAFRVIADTQSDGIGMCDLSSEPAELIRPTRPQELAGT